MTGKPDDFRIPEHKLEFKASVREPRCELTDLYPGECGCRNHRNVVPDDEYHQITKGKHVIAQFPGQCRGCLVSPINVGDTITAHEGGWLLVSCGCNDDA